MHLLDVFFQLAVPLALGATVVAPLVLTFAKGRGIYRGEDGAARRDDVNARYRTNAAAIVICVVFLGLWGAVVAGLLQEWGATFGAFLVAALLVVPFGATCGVVIMLYVLAIHAYASLRDR